MQTRALNGSKLVLEYEQIVGGGDGDDVLRWMPGGVQDLLVEVEAVHAHLVLFPLAAGANLLGLERRLGPGDVARRLERHVALRRPVEHAEEVVVRAGEDGLVVIAPAALELVEDAVVLVQRAQLGAQVLVNGVRLDGLRLHVQVPHLDAEVVAREHVAARAREFHVGNARDDLRGEATVRRVLSLLEHCNNRKFC